MSDDAMRRAFEAWASAPPYELSVERYPEDERTSSWPGQYAHYETQLAWEAWRSATTQAGADLRDTLEEITVLGYAGENPLRIADVAEAALAAQEKISE